MIQKILKLIELDPLGWEITTMTKQAVYDEGKISLKWGTDRGIRIDLIEIEFTNADASAIGHALIQLADSRINKLMDDILDDLGIDFKIPEGWEQVPDDGIVQKGDQISTYAPDYKWVEVMSTIGNEVGDWVIVRKSKELEPKIPEGWEQVPDDGKFQIGDRLWEGDGWVEIMKSAGQKIIDVEFVICLSEPDGWYSLAESVIIQAEDQLVLDGSWVPAANLCGSPVGNRRVARREDD